MSKVNISTACPANGCRLRNIVAYRPGGTFMTTRSGLIALVLLLVLGATTLHLWFFQPVSAQNSLTLALDSIVTGLSLPVGVTHAGDGSNRLFIVEQAGRIRIFQNGSLLATPFL